MTLRDLYFPLVKRKAQVNGSELTFRASSLDSHTMEIDSDDLALTMDPFENFSRWFAEAQKAMNGAEEATAMTLATASADAMPSARIVLFKGLAKNQDGDIGIQLFTNFDSPKSLDLINNPKAAIVFFWPILKRQLRMSGEVTRVSDSESNQYFSTRPRGSKIGAWASPQSKKIKDRAELLERVSNVESRFKSFGKEEVEIPRPSNWGGWLLVPKTIEFWQGRENRLHDRFVFQKNDEGQWRMDRLAP